MRYNDAIATMDHNIMKTQGELIREIETLRKERDDLLYRINNGRLETDIIQSENDYRRILEQIDDGYFEIDLNGTHTFCNKAMELITGYTPEELIGSSYTILMDERTAEQISTHFDAVNRLEAENKTVVYEIICKDKTDRIVEISVSLMHSPSGKKIGLRGIMRDITERLRDIDLQESFNTMRKALGQTVQALALALEVRDPYTAGHHRRVSDLARAIASLMGFTRDRIDGIRIAGSIHDIGKISIPAEILSKPASLTEIEYKLIKTHPQMGYDILKNIDFPWPVAMAIYQHHERINGTGYPCGLMDKNIILESKILAVADVVEAMSSYRPYRRAIGTDIAINEIKKNRGILYDGNVVEACCVLFNEKGYLFKD